MRRTERTSTSIKKIVPLSKIAITSSPSGLHSTSAYKTIFCVNITLHSRMHCLSIFFVTTLFGFSTVNANVIAERAVLNGQCTGKGSAPGVCIATKKCTSKGGTFITGACPGLANDIKCCTKPACGSGGNCRWTSQCSGTTVSNLCPGPAGFKCCVPSTSPAGPAGTYPKPAFPKVGACKKKAVDGAKKIVAGNPGKVRQIYCTRDCACPGTSDHCCGLATDMMCSSAGGVSINFSVSVR